MLCSACARTSSTPCAPFCTYTQSIPPQLKDPPVCLCRAHRLLIQHVDARRRWAVRGPHLQCLRSRTSTGCLVPLLSVIGGRLLTLRAGWTELLAGANVKGVTLPSAAASRKDAFDTFLRGYGELVGPVVS